MSKQIQVRESVLVVCDLSLRTRELVSFVVRRRLVFKYLDDEVRGNY